MKNLLLEKVEYKIEETRLGTWRRFLYPTGRLFEEFQSHRKLFGLPVLHYTWGVCPETGRRITARGIVAIGRRAFGVLAIGQLAVGVLPIGQLAIGLLGLGQGAVGAAAVGQVALGVCFGMGQLATGLVVIGQLAIGWYVLAQAGIGAHVWSQKTADPAAVEFFRWLASKVTIR